MTQPFADALTWVPKSRALGATLAQANDLARARGHGAVTLEHLLRALLEDLDAQPVLASCNIDLDLVGQDISNFIKDLPSSDEPMPVADPQRLRILEYAVAAAQQSKRREVNGAIVLAAIVGEGKSKAAELLQQRGLNFQDTVRALQRAAGQRPPSLPAATPPPIAQSAPESTSQSLAPPPLTPPPAAPPSLVPPAGAPDSSSGPDQLEPPPVPRQNPSSVASIEPDYEPAPASGSELSADDDPITAARLRIAAARTGAPLPPAPQPRPRAKPFVAAPFVPSRPDAVSAGGGWAPPASPGPAAYPSRMAPPMPPLGGPSVAADHGLPGRRAANGHAHEPRADVPWEDPHRAVDARPASSPVEPFDLDSLLDGVPDRLRVGRPVTVEVRIPRSALPSIATLIDARIGARADAIGQPHSAVVKLAVSVRLASQARGVFVEPLALETQWIDNRFDPMLDDDAVWRWTVTPTQTGTAPLQLAVAARRVGMDGVLTEAMFPDQTIDARVAGNLGQEALRWTGWLGAAAVGAVCARLFGDALWSQTVATIARLTGQ